MIFRLNMNLDITSTPQIWNAVKSAKDDNKTLHALCNSIADSARKLSKQAQQAKQVESMDSEEFQQALSVLDDPSRARAWMLTRLKAGMDNAPNAQIAKEMRDMLGIASRETDLVIQTVDFAGVPVDCPVCGANIHDAPEVALNGADGADEGDESATGCT